MARKRSKIVDKSYGITVSGPTRLIPDDVFTSGPMMPSMSDLSKPYANHAYVYACVRAIAQNIAQVPFICQTGTGKNPVVITEEDTGAKGDLFDVFETPNDLSTKYQLWEATITWLNLRGTSMWVLDRENATQVPENIWVFGPDNFIPIVNYDDARATKIVGWVLLGPNGSVLPLTSNQVVMFKFFNPYDPIFGIGPIEAARRGIKFDYLASIYGSNFFENSADPAGVLMAERKLTKQQVAELRDAWEQRHRGPGNAKKVGILWGGMKYQAITVSQKDMEFIEQRKWTLDELLAVFKVPKSELGLYEDVNHATSLSQDRSFWQKTLIPIIQNLQAVISSRITTGLRTTVDKTLKLLFDTKVVPALQEQFSEKIKNAEILFRMGWPINSINEKLQLGFPSVPWGDTWWLNQAIVPVEFVLEGRTTMNPKPSGPTVPGGDGGVPSQEDPPHNTPDDPTDNQGVDDNKRLILDRLHLRAAQKSKPDCRVEAINLYAKRVSLLLKNFLWRLRKHQLCIVVRNNDIFSKNDWSDKLSKKLKDSLTGFFIELGIDFPEVVLDNHPTIDELHAVLSCAPNISLGVVRDVFNQLTTDHNLMILSKRELIGAYKTVIGYKNAKEANRVSC